MRKQLVLFLSVLLVPLVLFAYDPRMDLLESGDFDSLLLYSRNTLIERGDSAENLFFLGAAYHGMGRRKLSDIAFESSLEHEDQTYRMSSYIANYYRETGQEQKLFDLYTAMAESQFTILPAT